MVNVKKKALINMWFKFVRFGIILGMPSRYDASANNYFQRYYNRILVWNILH